jgi:hypothetical protein
MSKQYSNEVNAKTLIPFSDLASVIGYSAAALLDLVPDESVQIDLFQKIVPGSAFSVLRNHTEGSGLYPDNLATNASPYYQPSIYALSVPLGQIVTLCREGKASCRFFSGGLAQQQEETLRLYCIDKNFLGDDFMHPYYMPFSVLTNSNGIGVYKVVPAPSSPLRGKMHLRIAGLVALEWRPSVPFKITKRAVPKINEVSTQGGNGEPLQAAESDDEEPRTIEYPLPHKQETWLGVYEQPTAETNRSYLWCRPYTPFSQIKKPEFYLGNGYQKPKEMHLRIEDLYILFEDAIRFVTEEFKGNSPEAKKYRNKLKKIAETHQEVNNSKPVHPKPVEIDSHLWKQAYERGVKTVQQQLGSAVDIDSYNKLVQIVAAAEYAWKKASVSETCDATILQAALNKEGVLNIKQSRSVSGLIRKSLSEPNQYYRKRDDKDPCVLNTRLKVVLDVARILEEWRRGSGTTRTETIKEMNDELEDVGVTGETQQALSGILVPKQLY